MTVTEAICERLRVPCTPAELSACLQHPERSIRAALYNLRKQNRVQRLDLSVRVENRRGRPYEHLWVSVRGGPNK